MLVKILNVLKLPSLCAFDKSDRMLVPKRARLDFVLMSSMFIDICAEYQQCNPYSARQEPVIGSCSKDGSRNGSSWITGSVRGNGGKYIRSSLCPDPCWCVRSALMKCAAGPEDALQRQNAYLTAIISPIDIVVLQRIAQCSLPKVLRKALFSKTLIACWRKDAIHCLQTQLAVRIAPFLYGHRYTSFGRHFTASEKLQEVILIMSCSLPHVTLATCYHSFATHSRISFLCKVCYGSNF